MRKSSPTGPAPVGATLAKIRPRRWRSDEARRGRHLSAAVQPALRVGIFGAAGSSRSRPANPAAGTRHVLSRGEGGGRGVLGDGAEEKKRGTTRDTGSLTYFAEDSRAAAARSLQAAED